MSGTPEQRLTAGAVAFQHGDTATAIKEFKNAIRLDQNFAPAYYNLGICYSLPATRGKAIEQFTKAIAHDPRYADAYVALGQAYLRLNSPDSAVGILKRGLALSLPPEPFYANLGYCYLQQANKDSSLLYYHKAIACDSTKSEYYFNIAYQLSKPEETGESVSLLRRARYYSANKTAVSFLLGSRLLDKPGRSRAETAEGIALLKDYLANGDGEAMKTNKANEQLMRVGIKQ